MISLFLIIPIIIAIGFFWRLRELRQKEKKVISKIAEIGKEPNKKIRQL
jgi:hypothetical protein